MTSWHFPRPNLATHYLNILDLGVSAHLAIIAPRRKGKTLFMLRDLAPLASQKRYLPIYASFWQNTNEPHEALISALLEAESQITQKNAFKRTLNQKIKSIAVSNDLLGRMEVEFAHQPQEIRTTRLQLFEKLLNRVNEKSGKRTLLLLIDEVQHLATTDAFDPFTHALRTLLDKHQGQIKTIFTGSSRHYMNLLFNATKSPFYHFVETLPFPDLDDHFLLFLSDKLDQEYGIEITLKTLRQTFASYDFSPYWLMKFISHLITFGPDVKQSQEYIQALLEASEGFEDIAKRMKPIDHIVFLALSNGKSPFSKSLLTQIDQKTQIKGIVANVQRSLKRLCEQHLISQIQKGEYYIEKPGLKRYLQQHQKK